VFKLPWLTLAVQRAGSMGNTDRQPSDSRVRAEGKGRACIKKGWERQVLSEADRKRKIGDSQRNGQTVSPLSSPPSGFGQQPAPPSTALREMEREKGKRMAGENRGTDESSREMWRGKEVQEEDTALTIRRTGEEGWETGQRVRKGGWRCRMNGGRRRAGLGDRYCR